MRVNLTVTALVTVQNFSPKSFCYKTGLNKMSMFSYFIVSLQDEQASPRSPHFSLLEDGSGLSSCAACALQGFKYPPNSLGDSSPLPAQIPPLVPAPGSSEHLSDGLCGQQPAAGAGSSFRSPSPLGLLQPVQARAVVITLLFLICFDFIIYQ